MKKLFLYIFFAATVLALTETSHAQGLPIPQPNMTPPGVVTSEEALPELATPRKTLDYFISTMENYAEGDHISLESAAKCMDLSDIPEFALKEQLPNLASKLYSVLIRTKYDRSKVPDKEVGNIYTLHSNENGEIHIEKDDINWKFSKSTIRKIPELYYAVKDEKPIKSISPDIEVKSSVLELRKYIPEVMTRRFIALEYWQILGLFVAVFIGWLAKISAFHGFRKTTNLLVRKAEVLSSARVVDRFVRPIAFLFAVYIFHLMVYLLDLDPVIHSRLLRLFEILKIICLFVIFSRSADLAAEIAEKKPGEIFGDSDGLLIPLIRTAAKFVLFFIGIVLVAGLFGINVTGLLAGLGIGGLALALAAKDTVENIFGSITVLIDRPFKVGDFITIEGCSGSVESIGLRSTRLRTPENSLLTIPNSKLISVIVDNLGARKFFRTRVIIGVTYETPLESLQLFCEGVRDLLKDNEFARRDYFVNFNEFAASSLNVLIQVYFQATSYSDYLSKQEDFFIKIIKVANHLGVEFAYPVQRSITASDPSSVKNPDREGLKAFLKDLAKSNQ